MMKGLVLPADLMDEIDRVLNQLQGKTQAACILLADISGQLIGQQGSINHVDTDIFSALIAGSMAATAEIARMLGEGERFKLLFHEGERQNLHLAKVGDSFLLVVVFNTTVQIGLVRLYTRQAIQQLLPLAEEFETLQAQPGEAIDADFGDALAAEMESAFGDWE